MDSQVTRYTVKVAFGRMSLAGLARSVCLADMERSECLESDSGGILGVSKPYRSGSLTCKQALIGAMSDKTAVGPKKATVERKKMTPTAPESANVAAAEQQFDAWFTKKVAGVAQALDIEVTKAEDLMLTAMQAEGRQMSHDHSALTAAGENIIVADTGATVRVIGSPRMQALQADSKESIQGV